MNTFKHILVPVDFGDATRPALDLALSVARASDARITLLHTFDITPFVSASPFVPMIDTGPILQALERQMAKLRDETKSVWPKVDSVVREGNVCEVILEATAAHGCDLVVIGTHGRRGLSHALLGSVAEKVVRLSQVPVLTVRPTVTRPAAETAARIVCA